MTQNLKFGRTYRVTIEMNDTPEGQPKPDPIVITLPFTMQFTVNRKIASNMNTCTVEIYNLGKRVRDLIFQEPWVASPAKKTLTLEAGYETMATIYKGTVWEAFSYRDDTDIITAINCLSGSWEINNSTVYTTLVKGQTLGDLYKFLTGQMTGLQTGAIGDFPQVIQRPVTLNGNAWDIFKTYSNNQVFIDNDKVYVLQRNEAIEGEIGIINIDTGILQTPKRAAGYVQVQTMFEPRVRLGQSMNLDSTVMPIYNGTYKVNGIQHTGIISAAVGGDCRTIIDLFAGNLTFKTVRENG